ncbi:MAG: hypothetical protein WBB35_13630, partial [Saprospiraceae bacterium]
DIGYMVETPASYPNLTVVENLQVYHTLRGLKEPRASDQIVDTLDNDRANEVLVKQGIKVSKTKAGPLASMDRRGLEQPELLSKDLFNAGLAVRSFHIVQEDLESFFLRMIQPSIHTNQA